MLRNALAQTLRPSQLVSRWGEKLVLACGIRRESEAQQTMKYKNTLPCNVHSRRRDIGRWSGSSVHFAAC